MNSAYSISRAKRFVLGFFVLLTVFGLLTLDDYGVPCDEYSEQVILQENLKEYAYRLAGPESGAVRFYDAQGVARISESIERDHGQAAYYAAAPILRIADGWARSLLWHAYTWLWFMAGVLALYLLLRELGAGRLIACAGTLLLYLAPRFFAEGHYNNKDMVLLSLSLMTLAIGARLMREPTYRRGLCLSLCGALAANTKIAGGFAWALCCLMTLASLIARKKLDRRALGVGGVTLLSFFAFYAAMTPALWGDASAYLGYVLGNAVGFTRWTGVVVFRGAVYDPSAGLPLPRWYLPYMIAATTPLLFVALIALGQLLAVRRLVRARGARLSDPCNAMLLTLTLFWALPLLFAFIARPLVYNGWRHFYFVYAGLCALGGYGLHQLSENLRRAPTGQALCAIALSLCMLSVGLQTLLSHPFQYTYYSPLVSGYDVSEDFELDYWNVGAVGTLKRLCTQDRDTSLELTVAALNDLSQRGVNDACAALPAGFRPLLRQVSAGEANYLVENTTYDRIYATPPPEGYHALFSQQAYGRDVWTVYERN